MQDAYIHLQDVHFGNDDDDDDIKTLEKPKEMNPEKAQRTPFSWLFHLTNWAKPVKLQNPALVHSAFELRTMLTK